MAMTEDEQRPRRWRIKLIKGAKHPNGSDSEYFYGCYFPQTDLVVNEMARPGTGIPSGVEWLDEPSELMKKMGAV